MNLDGACVQLALNKISRCRIVPKNCEIFGLDKFCVVNGLLLRNTTTEFRHKGFSPLSNVVQNFLMRHLGVSQGIVFTQFANVFCIKAVA